MTDKNKTSSICLNMIVRNEADIILQTLENILEHIPIRYWVICDTGSTDNTVDIIQNFFQKHDINGELHHDEWVDFAHNRNLALQRCEGKSDYIFICDADDRITGNLSLPEHLNKPTYDLRMKSAERDFYFYQTLLIQNHPSFHWIGVLHESLVNKNNIQPHPLQGDYFIQVGHFGARNQDIDKYIKDAKILEKAFEQEQNISLKMRYAHYCACSYHSAQQHNKAIEWFLKRIQQHTNTDQQELYLAYRYLGMQFDALNQPANALFYWLEGYNSFPQYAECLYEVIRTHNDLKHHFLAYQYLSLTKNMQMPIDIACEPHVYMYGLDYEMVRSCTALKYWQEALDAIERLLVKPNFSVALDEFLLEQLHEVLAQQQVKFKRQQLVKIQTYLEHEEHFKSAPLAQPIMQILRKHTF